jgi:hypothetical protein
MVLADYIFARLYGYTLGRRYRNTPPQACQDAITWFMIITGVPALLIIAVLLTATFPQLASSKSWIPWAALSVGVALYLGTRRLERYAATPDVGSPFSSPNSRRITLFAFFAVLLGSIVVAGAASRALMYLGRTH